MASAHVTRATAANFIPEIWADEVIEALEFRAVVQKRINSKYESELKVGDTLHVPRLSNLTAKDKVAETDVEFEAITETEQQVTVSTHKYAAFLIEDIVAVQSDYELRQKYGKKIGYALSRAIETDLSGQFDALSQVVGSIGVELTPDDYTEVWQKLAEAGLLEDNPDPGEDFSLFLSPAAYAAALKVDTFQNRQYNTAADVVQKAQVGDIMGIPVFISNLLESPDTGQHNCAAIHRDCYALVVQRNVPIRSDFLIEKIGDAVVGWTIYGSAEINFPPETPGGGVAVDNRGVYLATV